jgi:predicted enzyme related to lactoylglutathione lyase
MRRAVDIVRDVRVAAVIYVGNLDRMRELYEGCFGLTVADGADGYCGLESEAWLLTLVRSADALPASSPAARRADTPAKLAFAVADIDALRPIAASLGGQVNPPEAKWEFRNAVHCDRVHPEGNVVQLIAPLDGRGDR